ncbi:DUF1972 domain-containing protein [Klebsiella aerogenes]|uniref:DUF1972 domain-containing protein n=1 Tax=Klebsiella aerogenes TaxID=548 RepID=UPI001F44F21E|nr:DUF1972 domain-containing protein [Klebsiella aerogenes]HBQ1805929.1 DUF1972 domain-containing protein [Klebsiella aerogenes]HBQ2427776.1 DUF1972 domain-containing protein [Klebsiella aerogenes]HCM5150084.1 DUF1972 domain-containing protein [Klebsiella aerogenes]HDT3080933.1 DUF1972 domain-containing protein [Klebsiella aerogenes]HDU4640148.1 DUF1972 domain-containing protein [Klebsiella aerogenes]
MKTLIITGIRGLPAAHGGFETFAENLALHLHNQGWSVIVYCQEDTGAFYQDEWNGIKLIHIPVKAKGALGTVLFDLKTIIHSFKLKGLILTLGYNTAIFNGLYYLTRRKNVINMDGIEWRRDKWGKVAKTWFWLNERFGCWFGSHLIADHPKIKEHLATRVNEEKITMIPYGAHEVLSADENLLEKYSVKKEQYFLVVARAEPENSILEIVEGFSQYTGNIKLLILGNYDFINNEYHRKVQACANSKVIFAGAVYDKDVVAALRFYCYAYIHGHQVGGTNPSLVEALGAGNAVIAHDNKFNRWVIGEHSLYFKDAKTCAQLLNELDNNQEFRESLVVKSKDTYNKRFTWNKILDDYTELLTDWQRRK